MRNGSDKSCDLVQRVEQQLQPVAAHEPAYRLKDVGSVTRVVVAVLGCVVDLDDGQPVLQNCIIMIEFNTKYFDSLKLSLD